MSYQGSSAPGDGFWSGNPQSTRYGIPAEDNRTPYGQNGRSPYPTPTPVRETNDSQHWEQNRPGNTGRQYSVSDNASKGYYAPAPVLSHIQQPQFITPAQIFQQPAPPATHLNPNALTRPPSVSLNNPAVMGNTISDQQPDKPLLLISLAEEYFDAAHKLGPTVALSMTHVDVDRYQELIATGLGCLDAALKRVKLQPRLEANVRLRYASVLYEETDNSMEAETALSRGIALCDRNHYFDIKYAMQYLQAQLLANKNPKAAMKALDGHISEAQEYQHYSWVYALRFLRASYALESGHLTDSHAAIQNLQKIAELANRQGDRAIHLMASLVEAMAHLKIAGSESTENLQRAIAAARTHQFDVGRSIPALDALTHIIDVMSTIRQGTPQQMMEKLKAMQAMMDDALSDSTWSSSNDALAIPINRTPKSSQTVSHDTRMVLGIGEDGGDNLMMSFANKRDIYAVSYLLCGVVLLTKNPNDQKGMKYLDTGIASLTSDTKAFKTSSGLLPALTTKRQWRGQILCYMRLYSGFCAAGRADWAALNRNIEELKSTAASFEIPLSGPLASLTMYLKGVYYQGNGDFDAALDIYQDRRFNLSMAKTSNVSSADQLEKDISLLAALNTLWILQDAPRMDVVNNAAMLATLEPICSNHPNTDIKTAFNLAMATVKTQPPPQLFTIKSYLGSALAGARATANTQFLCISLNVMCSKFFANVVGSQAEKSAQAASVQAQKSGNVLWRSVADGMLSKSYEVQGKKEEAQATWDQARKFSQMAMSGN